MCKVSDDVTAAEPDLFQCSSIREQQLSSQSVDRQSEMEMRHQELQKYTRNTAKNKQTQEVL